MCAFLEIMNLLLEIINNNTFNEQVLDFMIHIRINALQIELFNITLEFIKYN